MKSYLMQAFCVDILIPECYSSYPEIYNNIHCIMVLLIIFLWPIQRMFQQDYCECNAVRCTIIPESTKLKRNNKTKPNQKETGNILHKIRCVFIGFLFDKTIFLPQGRQQTWTHKKRRDDQTKSKHKKQQSNVSAKKHTEYDAHLWHSTAQHREREISFACSYKFTDEKAEVAKIWSIHY